MENTSIRLDHIVDRLSYLRDFLEDTEKKVWTKEVEEIIIMLEKIKDKEPPY